MRQKLNINPGDIFGKLKILYEILQQPAKWGAYFVFIGRESQVVLKETEDFLLMEFLESIDPNIWVQNRDFVSLLLRSFIKYSFYLIP